MSVQESQIQELVKRANALEREDKWEEALLILQEVVKSRGGKEDDADLEKVRHVKATSEKVQRALKSLEQRLAQAAERPALIDMIMSELEELKEQLHPLIGDFPDSVRLRNLEIKVTKLLATATQQHHQGSQRLQQLLDRAQTTSDLERKTFFLRQATQLALDVIPTNKSYLALHEQLLSLLDLTERTNQTMMEIELNLDTANYREIHDACLRFEQIRPALLHTRQLSELEQRLVHHIRRHVKELTQAKKYEQAHQMMALLKKSIFEQSISKREITHLDNLITRAAQRVRLPSSYLFWFLSGFLVGCILFAILYVHFNG